MRVVIDAGRCQGHGQCVAVAPDVFEIGDDAVARVVYEGDPDEVRDKVEDAVRRCPAEAIALVD